MKVGALAPDLAGGVHDQLELGPLLVPGEEVPFHRGSEAALRAEASIGLK